MHQTEKGEVPLKELHREHRLAVLEENLVGGLFVRTSSPHVLELLRRNVWRGSAVEMPVDLRRSTGRCPAGGRGTAPRLGFEEGGPGILQRRPARLRNGSNSLEVMVAHVVMPSNTTQGTVADEHLTDGQFFVVAP
jgi:hypothetical protein